MTLDPVEFTADLIRCPSVTPSEGGALDLLQRTLEWMGFTCHRLPFSDVDTPDGLVPPDAVVGDAVMLCLDAATGDVGAVVAAADAADARGLHLAIAAPSALAAAATERGVTFVPLDTLDRDAFQRGFDDLLTGLERPKLVSLADLEAMTTCL